MVDRVYVCYWYQFGDDWYVVGCCCDVVVQLQVVVGVEEHLGDGVVGAGVALLHEVQCVVFDCC